MPQYSEKAIAIILWFGGTLPPSSQESWRVQKDKNSFKHVCFVPKKTKKGSGSQKVLVFMIQLKKSDTRIKAMGPGPLMTQKATGPGHRPKPFFFKYFRNTKHWFHGVEQRFSGIGGSVHRKNVWTEVLGQVLGPNWPRRSKIGSLLVLGAPGSCRGSSFRPSLSCPSGPHETFTAY